MFALSGWHLYTSFIYLTIQFIIFTQCNPVEISSPNNTSNNNGPTEESMISVVLNNLNETRSANDDEKAILISIPLLSKSNNEKNGNNSDEEKIVENNSVVDVEKQQEPSATTTSASNIDFYNNLTNQVQEISDNDLTTITPKSDYEVHIIEQPLKCDNKSEIFSQCANSCPASCEEPERKRCDRFCWKGCECAPGFVKNHRYRCIPKEQCPKCSENEHYRNCGPSCEPTCSTYQNLPVYCNQYNCKRGCFCNYGYVRDKPDNGTCIPMEKCPNNCGPNEYWDVNGEPCIRSADNPRPDCLFEQSKPSCVCDTGYKRNPVTKQCTPIALSEIKCGPNETYSQCGTDCGRKCFDEQKREKCPTICTRGCFCNEGYRRNYDGRCVLPDDCSQGNPIYSLPGSPIDFA